MCICFWKYVCLKHLKYFFPQETKCWKLVKLSWIVISFVILLQMMFSFERKLTWALCTLGWFSSFNLLENCHTEYLKTQTLEKVNLLYADCCLEVSAILTFWALVFLFVSGHPRIISRLQKHCFKRGN